MPDHEHEPPALQHPQGKRSSHIVAKAGVLILVVGATGVALLAERQKRFEAAHDMTVSHRRADELEREARKLRAELADRLTPSRIEAMTRPRNSLEPILWGVRPVAEATDALD